jgi:hypothetical protein
MRKGFSRRHFLGGLLAAWFGPWLGQARPTPARRSGPSQPPAGGALVYTSYLRGTNPGPGNAIVVDAAGQAFVTGYTWSTDFPTTRYDQFGRLIR